MAKNGSVNNQQSAENVFAGGGEMGSRIRELDWSKTALGAVESWQQSLKTAVRIMLNSRYPMFVWWGAERIKIYNDAYIPVLGKRHPAALGKSAREVWGDIWNVVGPQSELVFNEGRSTWNEEVLLVMERNDFTEETYFTFSYSPITDDDGGIGGMFCVCTEDTAKVVGRRRLQTLRFLGERTAEAGTAEQACAFAAETLRENPACLPFTLIYLLDADNGRARLYETTGIEKGTPAAPPTIEISAGSADIWKFGEILRTGKKTIAGALAEKFGALPAGTLNEAPQKAIVLPLAKTGKADASLAGFLVAALSPNLAFDDEYRSFTELVAGHITTAIANTRALEEERKRAEALAALDHAKTEFFSNVSHEFRTPLTLMLGNLEEVLRKEEKIAPTEREQIETAHRNSLRLLKLVNNLLDFSRLEAGKAVAEPELTDLPQLTIELASNFRAGIEHAGIEFKVVCPPLAEKIAIDREMWEKIVLNLLSNAFKFTLKGEIEIALHERGAAVVLQVRDTGVGIPAEELSNIFERFHRVRTVQGRTHEGTGIGLALVEELVRLHDGTIEVDSAVGRGTVFTVTIPKLRTGDGAKNPAKIEGLPASAKMPRRDRESYLLLDAATDDRLNAKFAPAENALLPFYPSAKILLADDNADMRGYISRLLGENGYQVETAADGLEALELMRNSNGDLPDLVLTDVMMPRLDGFGLLEEIRRDERICEVPVVMLSARAGEEAKIEGFEAGADDYLIKPFSARELLARVNSVIELAKMRRAVEAEREKSFAVLESVGDAFYALDSEFRFAFLNRRAEKHFGLSREELIGKNALEIFPAGYGTRFQTEFERAIREKVPVEFEVLSPLSQRWVEVHAYPSRQWLLVYFRDITERKKTEEMLLGSEERFRGIVNQTISGIAETDLGGRFLFVNDRYCEITGYTRGELLGGMRMQDITYAADLPRNLEMFQKSLTDGKGFEIEKRYLRKDGTPVWVLNSVSTVCDADGKPHSIVAASIDITKRKLAEEALRDSQTHLALTTEAAQVGTWQWDIERNEIVWSPIHKQFWGFEPTPGVISIEDWARLIEENDLKEAQRAIESCRRGEGDYDVEYRITPLGKTGFRWIRSTGKAVFDQAGKAVSMLGVSFDTTERKRIEETLAETARSLSRERERLNIALRTGSLGAYEWRTGDEAIWWSPETYPLYGVDPNDFTPTIESFTALIHPDDRAELWRKSEECIARGSIFIHEYRIIRPDGALRWIYNCSQVVLNADGAAERITGVAADITDRKDAEQELAAQRRLYKSVTDNATTALLIMDERQQCVFMNPAAEKLTGYKFAETFGKALHEVVHHTRPDGSPYPLSECPIDQAFPTRNQMQGEEVFVHPDGHFYEVAFTASPLLDENGEPAGTVVEVQDITARKRNEEALQKSEAEFRLLADAVPQIVWVADAGGRLIYVNRQWTEYSGLDIEASRETEKLAALYHPDDREHVFTKWSRALETGTTFEIEARLRRRQTGEYRWFLIRSEPNKDARGNVLKWFGTSTDITAGKKAENRAMLLAQISELARRFDNPTKLLYAVSKIVGEHLEVRRCLFNEIDPENDTEIVHRDYCRGVASVAGRHKLSVYSSVTTGEMLAGKTVVNEDSKTDPRTADFYERTYRPAGERAYIAVPLLRENRWVASLWVSDDQPREWSRGEVSLLEFIAEQVWAVVEKLRIDAALRESEARFRNMADNAPVMIWVTDATGYCNYLSQSWYEFTGQTPETGLGYGWLDATHPHDMKIAEEAFVSANEKQEPFRVEYRLRRRDGEYRWAIDSAQPRFGENGEFLGYIGSVIDITDRKVAEQERERLLVRETVLREEAEKANRLKDEFLATVSHELRTPLNSMLGWATMVRQNGYDAGIMRRAFEVVERNARNQNQIISDILDVSRIITGKLNLNLQPVELSTAVLAAIDTVRPAIDAKSIRLETNLEPDRERVNGDADRLQQIVWNLLSNAVKFTPEGGQINIASRYAGDFVEIRIADNGSGIEEDFLPFVFDRFRQADGRMNRKHGGLGLGLSIVRHLTELHGGSVFAASKGAGHGSIFTLRFPLKTRPVSAGEDNAEILTKYLENQQDSADSPRRLLEGLKILVVDDEPDALELAAFILTEQHAAVFTASSAEKALEIFATENFDVIVSDIGMPETDGLELIGEINARASQKNRPLPSIALTAYAREEDSRRVLEAGFDAYLPKPVEPPKLIETILEITNKA